MRSPLRRADLFVLVLLAIAVRIAAAAAIPLGVGRDFNCAPDEAGHFWVAHELAAGRTATWPESASIYSAYLPSQYAVHVAFAALARRVDPAWAYPVPLAPDAQRVRGYPVVRLGSILLGAATVAALALAAATWTTTREAGLVAGAIAALYPQLVFVGAYTNGDAFTVAAGALLVLALAVWARNGEGATGMTAVGAAIGAVLLGKPNGYALLPGTFAWIGWAAARNRVDGRTLARAGAIAAAVAGPILVWNAVRNGGDVLGLAHYGRYLGGPYRPRAVANVDEPVVTFARLLATSAFGVLSNMSRALPTAFFLVAASLLVVGLAAAVPLARATDARTARGVLWLAGGVVLGVALVAANAWRVDFQPQGRYVLLVAVLATIVAAIAPRARGGAWRLWPALYVAFVAVAAIETEILLYRYPCG